MPNILDDIIASVVENKIPAGRGTKLNLKHEPLEEPKAEKRKQWKKRPNCTLTSLTAGSTNAGCSGSKTTAIETTGNFSGSAGDKDRSVKQTHKNTESYITFCSAGAVVLLKATNWQNGKQIPILM